MIDDDNFLPAVSNASLPAVSPAPATPKSGSAQPPQDDELVDVCGTDRSSSLFSATPLDSTGAPKSFPPPAASFLQRASTPAGPPASAAGLSQEQAQAEEPHPSLNSPTVPPEISKEKNDDRLLRALLQTAMICKLVIDSPKDSYYQNQMLEYLESFISKPDHSSGAGRRQQARELLNHIYWLYQSFQKTPGYVDTLLPTLSSSLDSYIKNIRSENGWIFKIGNNSRLAYALEKVRAGLLNPKEHPDTTDIPEKIKESTDFMGPVNHFEILAKSKYDIENALQEMILSELIDLNQKAIQQTGVKKSTYSPISKHLMELRNIRDENFNPITDVDEKIGVRLQKIGMINRWSLDIKTKSLIDYLRNFLDTKKQSTSKSDKKATAYFNAFNQWFEQVEITNPQQDMEEERQSSCASRLFGRSETV